MKPLISSKQAQRKAIERLLENKCHRCCFNTTGSPPDSKSSRIGHHYTNPNPLPPQTKHVNIIVHFFSTLFFSLSRHRTIKHCHKHSCRSRRWLRHGKTLPYSLQCCTTRRHRRARANTHCWERDERDGKGDSIKSRQAGYMVTASGDTRSAKHLEEEGNFTTIVQQLV